MEDITIGWHTMLPSKVMFNGTGKYPRAALKLKKKKQVMKLCIYYGSQIMCVHRKKNGKLCIRNNWLFLVLGSRVILFYFLSVFLLVSIL